MNDSIVVTVITLLYTASSGVIFYLNQHFFISKKSIRQVVNWPLAKIRNAIVTSILRLFSEEGGTIFENERAQVEEFYDTILIKQEEERKVLALERRLKILKTVSMINIALPMIFLFGTVAYLFYKCSEEGRLINIVQANLKTFVIFLCLPWVIYFVLYFWAVKCKTQLDATEPRNTQERDEE